MTTHKGHDMSQHWRLVSVDGGPVTGTFWEFSGAPSRCDLEDRAEAWRLAPRPRGMDR